MDNVAFLIFRRMRAPLIVLIIIYSVSVMGLVLIPGQAGRCQGSCRVRWLLILSWRSLDGVVFQG